MHEPEHLIAEDHLPENIPVNGLPGRGAGRELSGLQLQRKSLHKVVVFQEELSEVRRYLSDIHACPCAGMVLILCATERDVESVAELMEDGLDLREAQELSVLVHRVNHVRHCFLILQHGAADFGERGDLVLVELAGPPEHVHYDGSTIFNLDYEVNCLIFVLCFVNVRKVELGEALVEPLVQQLAGFGVQDDGPYLAFVSKLFLDQEVEAA